MAKKSSVAKKKSATVGVKTPLKKVSSKSALKSNKAHVASAKATGKSVDKPAEKVQTKLKTTEGTKTKTTKQVKSTKQVPVKIASKGAKESLNEKSFVKPELMSKKVAKNESKVKDQGELLIEKAKEEMFKINGDAKQAEKASKVKPIKIERGNAADEKAKWQELNKRHGKEKAQVYKMTEVFEAMKPIQHKVLGWGFVLSNENNRLEVLFENGIKMLISNYKPS